MRVLLVAVLLCLSASCMGAPDPEKLAQANEVVLETEGIQALKKGEPAPAFTATATTGERVTVGRANVDRSPAVATDTVEEAQPGRDTEADKTETVPAAVAAPADDAEKPDAQVGQCTVLYFYPADFTPNSTKHLKELTSSLDDLAGVEISVYGISASGMEKHLQYAAEQEIKVPLLADAGTIAASYGTIPEGGKYPQRTLVGIAADGTIAFYKRGFGHLKLADIILQGVGRTLPEE